MPKPRYTVKPLVLDDTDDAPTYRNAFPSDPEDEVVFGVYEDGSFCDVYPSDAEARKAIKELRD